MKPTILIENNVFFEDEKIENNSALVAATYFVVATVDHFLETEDYLNNKHFLKHNDYPMFWRGSFGMKAQMTRFANFLENDKLFDCLYWLPALKQYAHNFDYIFLDAEKILTIPENQWPMFIKPVRGTKAFSGYPFTKEKFQEEFNFFTRNLNESPYIICQCSPPNPIEKEYRLVVVDNKVIAGCQYLENAERIDKQYVPIDAWNLANEIVKNDFFLNNPNFVIDIAQNGDKFTLLEINSIHTSSFYTCDLDAIYERLANYYATTIQ